MSGLKLSPEEVEALSLFETDDLSDPIALVRRAGRDVGTFFENGRFHGLDVSRADIMGVSFRGATLTGTIMRKNQESSIRATLPRKFTNHAAYVKTPQTTEDHLSKIATQAFHAARELIEQTKSNGATKLDFVQTRALQQIPPEISYLTSLEELTLHGTQVSDITPLSSLSNLRVLNLGRTRISSLAPLVTLTKLQQLNLNKTAVRDVSSLSALTELETLHLNGTWVSNAEPLSVLMKLQTLHLNRTLIDNVAPIAKLTALRRLYLNRTPVSDVSPLSTLVALYTLDLRDTHVADIKPLNKLRSLEDLRITGTPAAYGDGVGFF